MDRRQGQRHADLVVCIDDDVYILETLRLHIEALGLDYFGSTSPTEALAALDADGLRPSMIMVDLDMPEMGGLGVCDSIRARDWLADVPIVILSRHADASTFLNARAAGADDYLRKPFSAKELRRRLVVWTDPTKGSSRKIKPRDHVPTSARH